MADILIVDVLPSLVQMGTKKDASSSTELAPFYNLIYFLSIQCSFGNHFAIGCVIVYDLAAEIFVRSIAIISESSTSDSGNGNDAGNSTDFYAFHDELAPL